MASDSTFQPDAPWYSKERAYPSQKEVIVAAFLLVTGSSESSSGLHDIKEWRDSLLSKLGEDDRAALQSNEPSLRHDFVYLRSPSPPLTTAKEWISLASRATGVNGGVRSIVFSIAQLKHSPITTTENSIKKYGQALVLPKSHKDALLLPGSRHKHPRLPIILVKAALVLQQPEFIEKTHADVTSAPNLRSPSKPMLKRQAAENTEQILRLEAELGQYKAGAAQRLEMRKRRISAGRKSSFAHRAKVKASWFKKVASLVTQQVERTVNQARDAHKSDLALLARMADAASHAAQESKTQAAKQSENDNIRIKALERKMARMMEEGDLSKQTIRMLGNELRYHELDADLSKEKLLEYEEEILTEGSDLRNIKDLTHRPGQSYKQATRMIAHEFLCLNIPPSAIEKAVRSVIVNMGLSDDRAPKIDPSNCRRLRYEIAVMSDVNAAIWLARSISWDMCGVDASDINQISIQASNFYITLLGGRRLKLIVRGAYVLLSKDSARGYEAVKDLIIDLGRLLGIFRRLHFKRTGNYGNLPDPADISWTKASKMALISDNAKQATCLLGMLEAHIKTVCCENHPNFENLPEPQKREVFSAAVVSCASHSGNVQISWGWKGMLVSLQLLLGSFIAEFEGWERPTTDMLSYYRTLDKCFDFTTQKRYAKGFAVAFYPWLQRNHAGNFILNRVRAVMNGRQYILTDYSIEVFWNRPFFHEHLAFRRAGESKRHILRHCAFFMIESEIIHGCTTALAILADKIYQPLRFLSSSNELTELESWGPMTMKRAWVIYAEMMERASEEPELLLSLDLDVFHSLDSDVYNQWQEKRADDEIDLIRSMPSTDSSDDEGDVMRSNQSTESSSIHETGRVKWRRAFRNKLYTHPDETDMRARPVALQLIKAWCKNIVDNIQQTSVADFLPDGKFHNLSDEALKQFEGLERTNDKLAESIFGAIKNYDSIFHAGIAAEAGVTAAKMQGLFDLNSPFALKNTLTESEIVTLYRMVPKIGRELVESSRDLVTEMLKIKAVKAEAQLQTQLKKERDALLARCLLLKAERYSDRGTLAQALAKSDDEARNNNRLTYRGLLRGDTRGPSIELLKRQITIYTVAWGMVQYKVTWKGMTRGDLLTHLHGILESARDTEPPHGPTIAEARYKKVKPLGAITIEAENRIAREASELRKDTDFALALADEKIAQKKADEVRVQERRVCRIKASSKPPPPFTELCGKAIEMLFQGTGLDGEEIGEEEEEHEPELFWLYGEVQKVCNRGFKLPDDTHVRKNWLYVRWDKTLYEEADEEAYSWVPALRSSYGKINKQDGWVVVELRWADSVPALAPVTISAEEEEVLQEQADALDISDDSSDESECPDSEL